MTGSVIDSLWDVDDFLQLWITQKHWILFSKSKYLATNRKDITVQSDLPERVNTQAGHFRLISLSLMRLLLSADTAQKMSDSLYVTQ